MYHSKLTLIHPETNIIAICEIKVWKISDPKSYPNNIKYSLFCVEVPKKNILVGFDNHFPKSPHKHINDLEIPYNFINTDKLIDDFWEEVQSRGFIL